MQEGGAVDPNYAKQANKDAPPKYSFLQRGQKPAEPVKRGGSEISLDSFKMKKQKLPNLDSDPNIITRNGVLKKHRQPSSSDSFRTDSSARTPREKSSEEESSGSEPSESKIAT